MGFANFMAIGKRYLGYQQNPSYDASMQVSQLNFRSLRLIAVIFQARVWLHRSRMILTRLLAVGGLVWLYMLSARPEGYSTNFSGTLNLTPVIVVSLGLWLGLRIGMGWFWQQFAADNKFEIVGDHLNPEPTTSFGKYRFGSKFGAIAAMVEGRKIYLQLLLYKEGGILRWREYKLDLALRIEPDPAVAVPHIVADATARDDLQESNLQRKLSDYVAFQAEGSAGAAYRLYAQKEHTVDALAILTPDVLQELLDFLPGADVEFKDGSIWFFYRNFQLTDENLQKLFNGTMLVMAELDKQLRPYRRQPGD